MEKGKQLPAPGFCNKEAGGKANPIYGKGALGNQSAGHMYYSGSDREKLVATVQEILTNLGYMPGASGVDGKFGPGTEEAVKNFQEEHEDWDGNSLNVDGLVGPETADALNRAMVGREADPDYYITPLDLTKDFLLVTATESALKKGISLEVEKAKKARVTLVSEGASECDEEITEVYNIAVDLMDGGGSIFYEIKGAEGHQYSGTSDESGCINHENVPVDEYVLTINGTDYPIPVLRPDEPPFQVFVDVTPPETEEEVDYSDMADELPESVEDDSDSGQYLADGSDDSGDANPLDNNTLTQSRDKEV